MSERITREHLTSALAAFAREFGYHVRTPESPIVATRPELFLDHYNPGDSRAPWLVASTIPGSSGETHPFGSRRRSAHEMWSCLWFATEAKRLSERPS